ncbi:MAG: hypothetical protein D6822_01680, partial [Cyanobacteria bacterium J149]
RVIGRDPEFITAATEDDDIPFEEVAKMTIWSQYHNPKLALLGEPIYVKLQKMVKESLICGTAIGRAYWRREGIKRLNYKARVEETGKEGDVQKMAEYASKYGYKLKFIEKYEETPFLDDFDLRHIPFFFFFPDPYFSEPGKMRFKIERDFYSMNELIAEAEMFGYDKAVMNEIANKDKRSLSFTPELDKDFMYRYNQLFADINQQTFTNDDARVQLLIVDKMWENGRVHVIVNEKYVLTGKEGMESPYKLIRDPFVFSQNVLVPHSFYSRSEIDAIKRIEDAMNDMTNMRLDNIFQALSSIYLVNNRVMEDADSFVPLPNSVWSVKDVDKAMREIKGQDVTAGVYKESSELYSFIQRIAGVTDYAKGGENITLAGRTYGGLRLAQEAANIRFLIKSTVFEQVTLKSLGYMMLEMARQFINKDRVVRIMGEKTLEHKADFYKIKAADLKSIKGFMDIQVIPSSTRAVDEQAEAMKLNGLADRIALQKPPFDRMTPELYDRFLLKYLPLFGFRDAIYWVRSMRGQEGKQKGENKPPKEEKQVEKPNTNLPVNETQMVTPTGIQNQPNPLEQLLANQAGIPNQPQTPPLGL